MKKIPFSPPDITEAEIKEVTDALRSGWITTGPKTKKQQDRKQKNLRRKLPHIVGGIVQWVLVHKQPVQK